MFVLFPGFPVLPFLLVHVLAAVLPAAYLLRYIYRHDTVEKEPLGLLASLFLAGTLAAVCSGALEGVAERLLNLFLREDSAAYPILTAFLVVAVVEEGTKFLFLKARTWRHPSFNYRFDGVVYAVFVSLGFAALENIAYVIGYGLSVAIPRAVLAVPGHMAFSVFMGSFYGRAKQYESRGYPASARFYLRAAYLVAVFLHGFYDACALSGTVAASAIFLLFVLAMFAAAFRTLKRGSAADVPVGGRMGEASGSFGGDLRGPDRISATPRRAGYGGRRRRERADFFPGGEEGVLPLWPEPPDRW